MANDIRIITVAYPNNGRQLKRLITGLLKSKLAACIQRINYVKSYYIREGELTKAEEKLLIIKTTQTKEQAVYDFIQKHHPYDVPEILSITPDKVEEAYGKWIGEIIG